MNAVSPPKGGLMPGASGNEELIFAGHPAVVANVGGLLLAVLTLGIWAIVLFFRSRSVRYTLTSQRVVVERGFFSKRMEQIDLYRVVDYVVERPFSQRLCGTGNLVLEASDKTTPEVRINGVKADVTVLYEKLRFATEKEKRRRGVRVLDADHHGA